VEKSGIFLFPVSQGVYVYVWLPRYIDYDRKKDKKIFTETGFVKQCCLDCMSIKSLCQGIYHILFDNMDIGQLTYSSLCLYSVCVRVRVSVCVIFYVYCYHYW